MSPSGPIKRTRALPISDRTRESIAAYVFLLPWLVGFLLITLGPILASLVLSFTNFNGSLERMQWVGIDNYVRMFTSDRAFWGSVRVTLLYVFVSVPIMLVFALAVAVALNRGLRFLGIYRTIFYLPSLLGTSVAIAVLWRYVFGQFGLVNQVLGTFGLEGYSYIGDPRSALQTIMVLNVWTFGAPMVIFLAGLRQIPAQLYEAAKIDGASTWERFWYITVPSLSPLVLFNGVLSMIGGFQAFTQVYVISDGSGGPAGSTMFYTLLLYQRAFTQLQLGYASAMAWILLLFIGAVTAALFLSAKYWVHYGEGR
jgi:multiple sugar transport system permease protein